MKYGRWICWLFGHKTVLAPFLPGSCQNWYDLICMRCGRAKTIMAGENQ